MFQNRNMISRNIASWKWTWSGIILEIDVHDDSMISERSGNHSGNHQDPGGPGIQWHPSTLTLSALPPYPSVSRWWRRSARNERDVLGQKDGNSSNHRTNLGILKGFVSGLWDLWDSNDDLWFSVFSWWVNCSQQPRKNTRIWGVQRCPRLSTRVSATPIIPKQSGFCQDFENPADSEGRKEQCDDGELGDPWWQLNSVEIREHG